MNSQRSTKVDLLKSLIFLHVVTLLSFVAWAMFQRSGIPYKSDWITSRAGIVLLASIAFIGVVCIICRRSILFLLRVDRNSAVVWTVFILTWFVGFVSLEVMLRAIAVEKPWGQKSVLGHDIGLRDWEKSVKYLRDSEAVLKKDDSFLVYSSHVGWCPGKNRKSPDGLYHSGKSAFRVANASKEESSHNIVLSLFGDSFIFGEAVSYEETIGGHLEQLMGASGAVQNWGVPAFGTDQAFIRYLEEGRGFKPKWVVLGLYSNDLMRNVNCFPFLRAANWNMFAKPRFVTEPEFRIVNSPVPQISIAQNMHSWRDLPNIQFDRYYREEEWNPGIFNRSLCLNLIKKRFPREKNAWQRDMYADANETTKEILKHFYQKVLEDKAQPLILYLPDPIYDKESDAIARRVLNECGLPFLDPSSEIQKIPVDDRFAPDRAHYSSRVNQVMAKVIFDALRAPSPESRERSKN